MERIFQIIINPPALKSIQLREVENQKTDEGIEGFIREIEMECILKLVRMFRKVVSMNDLLARSVR